nr:MAG TPA: Receptor Binding Protein [Caudoviricetes sp.]
MSEISRFFNRKQGDGTGDFTYSADNFAEFFSTFFSTGVVNVSSLSVYSTGSKVVVNKGYAIIDGHWYHNDAALTLANPTQNIAKRKDTIALKLDKEERKINAVWLTGQQDKYPTVTDTANVKYLIIANVELLSGGSIKAVYDKRTYCQALYTVTLQEWQRQWQTFLNACSSSYNNKIQPVTVSSELQKARGGFNVLGRRLDITDSKIDDISEAGSSNLFDYTKITPGWLDAYGSIEPHSNTYTTDYIPIEPGVKLYFYNNTSKAYCESYELYRTKSADGLIKNVSDKDSCINDSNAAYMRASFYTTSVPPDKLQITKSSAPTEYVAYKTVLKQCKNCLEYISDIQQLSSGKVYKIDSDSIASNAPVKIHIFSYDDESSLLVRADNKRLINQLTSTVVTYDTTDIQLTAADLIVGLKMTQGGTMSIKYYSKSCEDLFELIGNESGEKIVTANYSAVESDTDCTIVDNTIVDNEEVDG